MPLMEPPQSGVTVRMYRQGHGDCFLLAFRQDTGQPCYMLIDCGLKKGSEIHSDIEEVAADIRDATGGHLDVVVVTHEHEDHVSGFLRCKKIFRRITIDELWLAWTEDPNHALANRLRKRYNDTLIGLVAAGQQLQAAAQPEDLRLKEDIEDLIGFETEDGELPFGADVSRKIKGITNKKAIKLLRDRAAANRGTRYLRPHSRPLTLAGVSGVRLFVLGPPENEKLLKDMDPRKGEEFHLASVQGAERALLAASRTHAADGGRTAAFGSREEQAEAEANQPFATAYRVDPDRILATEYQDFFDTYYGNPDDPDTSWRHIDHDWLRATEQFALRMNSYVNNTSLVLAIELVASGKVLLFVGDAQRGNWVSWDDAKWTAANGLDRGEEIDADDLLSRTVLYKVGHHGSHNATLNEGGLQKMAQGEFNREFVAMIPANEYWAKDVKHHAWQHPLDAIYDAIYSKARGRVFLSDVDEIEKPETSLLPTAEWRKFKRRIEETDLYFDYTVDDAP